MVFFTGTPQFQYQKENLPSSQSRPFLVTGFKGTAALIGWLAVFFLVLKMGGTSEKNHPVFEAKFLEASNYSYILTPPTSPTNNGGERKITKILKQKIWSNFFWIKYS